LKPFPTKAVDFFDAGRFICYEKAHIGRFCMERLGVLSGTFMLERSDWIRKGKKQRIHNIFGEATAVETDSVVFILRHGDNPTNYILPHRVNHAANLLALKDLGVTEVIGINSTGSLKKNLRPGMIVIPDDFISFTPTPTICESKPIHVTPSFNESVRRKLIAAAHSCNLDVVETGIYWQTPGPRLETRAEIRMMSGFADIVGMTLVSEAVIALEMGLPYASACSIDNFGNGLVEKSLSLEEIVAGTRKNADLMIRLLQEYIQR